MKTTTPTRPSDVFVFAGAGLSFHSQLPGFNALRDGALDDLGLTASMALASEMLPEPFMNALVQSGFDVQSWLQKRFAHGEPTDGHQALEQLARDGANVWTVNFDELIESVSPSIPLDVCSWPDSPTTTSQLLKPHGTLSGEIIVTAEQVLGRIPAEWEERLREDVQGRTVLMIGYSGRDLDLRPIWADVLQGCSGVVWFEKDGVDLSARRNMLSDLDRAGKVEWREHDDPTDDFVDWCQRRSLVDHRIVKRSGPKATHTTHIPNDPFYRAQFQQLLGDAHGARQTLLNEIRQHPLRSLRGLLEQQVNHGSTPTARFLSIAAPVVAVVRPRTADALRRKALAIHANVGDHDKVLAATENYDAAATSVFATLRAASVRVTGNLEDSIAIARAGFDRAVREQHPVRAANAGFQFAQSLVWAHRLEEAADFLHDPYDLISSNSANRWIAWRQLLLAAIALHRDPLAAIEHSKLGMERFRSEGLLDGLASGTQTLLVAHRAAGDTISAERALKRLGELRTAEGTFYLRSSQLSNEWTLLAHAENTRLRGTGDAHLRYADLRGSRYPIMSSLADLGVALCDLTDGRDPTDPAACALATAQRIGALYQGALAADILHHRADPLAPLLFV